MQKILSALVERGIDISIKDGKIKATARNGSFDDVAILLIKENKQQLMEYLEREEQLAQQNHRRLSSAPPVALPLGLNVPVSPLQQRLWLLNEMSPTLSQPVSVTLELTGELDVEVLKHALRDLVHRHTILRTSFVTGPDGQALGIAQHDAPCNMVYKDLRTVAAGERTTQLRAIIADAVGRPLPLSSVESQLRTVLIQEAPQRHIFLMKAHRMVVDEHAILTLAEELRQCYQAIASGEALATVGAHTLHAGHVTSPPPLHGDLLDQQLAFWHTQLASLPLAHGVPLDFARPSVARLAVDSVDILLAEESRDLLLRACDSVGADLTMGIHAVFAALLARYSNETDVVIGIEHRKNYGFDAVVGPSTDHLVLRSKVSCTLDFHALLAHSKGVLESAYANQHIPFALLVEHLKPERSGSHSPLFQLALVISEALPDDADAGGVSFNIAAVHAGAHPHNSDITLYIRPRAQGLHCRFEYNTALFTAATMTHMATHFSRLLNAAVRAPAQRLDSLSLLSEDERDKVLHVWNASATSYPDGSSLHALFEQQVKRHPGASAAEINGVTMSYAELNGRANDVAHRLRQVSFAPETLVGLCVERSFDMLAAMLGILKAGGAYLPLDAAMPTERLAYMLNDARPALLLTQHSLQALISAANTDACIPVFCLETDCVCSALVVANPAPLALPGHLACVFYTSGSTGKPKGTLLSHQNVVRLLCNNAYYSLGVGERVLQYAPVTFDAATFEIWSALLNAGCLVLMPPGRLSNEELGNAIIDARLDMLFLTTALFHQMVEHQLASLASVRHVLTGGEALSMTHVRLFTEGAPNTRLSNCYGPTEVSTITTCNALTRDTRLTTSVPLGRPIANTETYILDEQLQPVPPGIRGELYIAGAGLARGYLGRPGLTAERFVANPFSTRPGTRMYRSGDLARYLADGQIEFLGRNDDQVKIRGFRIEPGEIESALVALPMVSEAVVLAREDGLPGEKRLAAYFVTDASKDAVSVDALRAALALVLPDYMLPSDWVALAAMPLTSNGKIDKRALPAPERISSVAFCPPSNSIETALAQILADVLQVPQVGIHDNFFHRGGHSLLATQVVSRVRVTFGKALPLRTMFEAPTVAALAQHLIEMTGIAGDSSLVPVTGEKNLLASYSQQRLWVLDQIEDGSVHYNMPFALTLSGDLDYAAVNQALTSLFARHESLRTCFATSVQGQAMQVIQEAPVITVPCVDLSTLPQIERDAEVVRRVAQDADTAFDLSKDLMLRVQLLKLAADSHIFMANMHHIASDGWSMGILIKEFSTLYSAYSQGQPNPLPPLAIQYSDYAHWQRSELQSDISTKQLDYWVRQLADLPTVHSLPLDFPRPARQTFAGDSIQSTLDVDVTARLKTLCQRNAATLFMGLHAAFSVFLARSSNGTDIVVGSPIANREHAEIAGLIGFFLNNLILRTDLSQDCTFTELVAQSKSTLLDAYAYQQVPVEMIIDRLQPQRSLSHSALFQVMLILQNNEHGELDLPGLRLAAVEGHRSVAKFDLLLSAVEGPQGLLLYWEYNVDLFLPSTISRMVVNFEELLKSLVSEPDQSVFKANMLSELERQQLLTISSGETVAFAKDRCVHELFEEHVLSQPESIALVYEDEQLSYRDLNDRANQLAHYLIDARHVTPDTLVGICIERSLEMIIGILAIQKAGGAYVPLDPDYPADRLAYMIQDAQLKTVLIQSHLRHRIPLDDEQALCIDDAAVHREIGSRKVQNVVPREIGLASRHLAYVIYTSGSTGNPKGVMISHANLVNLAQAVQRRYGLTSHDCFLQFATVNFDMSVEDIFSTLVSGACLVLRAEHWLQSTQHFWECCARHHVTILDLPTAYWHTLAKESHVAVAASVRHISMGGEQVSSTMIAEWMKYNSLGHPCLLNTYGPTECTVDSTFAPMTDLSGSIGRPLDNTKAYVLSAGKTLVPIGVVGELYIGGAGVARGYLNQPTLTAEKFVQNPFHDPADPSSSALLYRTGDLVRWQADGNLAFLGRIDHQVKLRGYRIELGEIEAALSRHADLRDAVVLAKDIDGEKRLVAYVEGRTVECDEEALFARLFTYLHACLPVYMVPSNFVLLPQLPLTPNGKVDRQALLNLALATVQVAFIAPETAMERYVCQLWQQILGIERIGRQDNFFALGGHSLIAAMVVARVRQDHLIEMPLRTLFEAATVAAFAACIEAVLNGPAVARAVVRMQRDDQAPLPLSFGQQRLWFLDQLEPANPFYNIPLALQLQGVLDGDALQQAVQEIVRRHEVLRTTFASVDGTAVQVIAPALALSMPRSDLAALPSAQRALALRALAGQEALHGFDLATGPLLRVHLVRMAANEHVLLLTVHHIVSDGWSTGVLLHELGVLYRAFVQGQASPLPELALQYADFAHWQRQWLSGDVLQAQLDYWSARMAGSAAMLNLPTDHPRPALQQHHGALHRFSIDAASTAGLQALAQQQGATLFMVMTAVFNILLSRYAGQDDICIGTPVANRNEAATEPLIGFFVNTLVLRTRIDPHARFDTLLAQVRNALLDDFAHQDLPFEKLVDLLNPVRQTGSSPLFQVMLSLQNTPAQGIDLPGITLQGLEGEHVNAKFDLTLNLVEAGGELAAAWEYDTALFAPATVARMARHLTSLISSIVRRPDERIGELSMLDAEERSNLLAASRPLPVAYPGGTLGALFEAQVVRTPQQLAVVCEEDSLSYAELNRRANQLGGYLHQAGIGRETLVGICLERSVDMLVAILAVWKAGAAYVPLDPAYPAARLGYMVSDAAPALLLTQQHLLARLADVSAVPRLCLDTDWAAVEGLSTDNISPVAQPANLAYVIYTSGSTGQPKGVAVSHATVVNLAHTLRETVYRHTGELAGLKVGLNASISFDASLQQLVSLLFGATLFVLTEQCRTDPALLSAAIGRWGLDVLDCTPSQLSLLLQVEARLPGSMLVGGEAIDAHLWQRLQAMPQQRFFNMYGPTETTVDATACAIGAAGPLPVLGGALENVGLYLLDAALQPVPDGVPGEVYLAGAGLARGYLHRPGLTAERFLPCPFGTPGARMYRTGDLARRLADGRIVYLGRTDQQVKLRGYRIELGEIEAALASLPDIAEASVTANADVTGALLLVAYIVKHSNAAALEVATLRMALQSTLPAYLVPAIFILLDRLPLTPSGKIDRKALPAPDRANRQECVAVPRSAIESQLAEIWASVLALQQIGIHDDFFVLGGNSLQAVRLLHLIKQRMGLICSLANFFAAPTIAGLAASLASAKQENALLVPLQPNAAPVTLFCVHPVGGRVFAYRQLADSLKSFATVYGIQSPEAAGLADRYLSLEAMANAYADQICQQCPEGPYFLAGWSTGGRFAIAIAHVLRLRGADVAYVAMLDTTHGVMARDLPEQVLADAMLGTLAALRGSSFSPLELVSMHAEMEAQNLKIDSLFSDAARDAAMPLLSKWCGIYVDAEVWWHLQQEVGISRHYLTLLGSGDITGDALPVYEYRAAGVVKTGVADNIYVTAGDHFSMLKAPHVLSLAEMMEVTMRSRAS